jgi:hypothetical protein
MIPETVNSRWIAGLADKQLVDAEIELHRAFVKHEIEEKRVRGDAYKLMRGPEVLVTAWNQWQLARNEAGYRGLELRRK